MGFTLVAHSAAHMSPQDLFSPNYATARERFCVAAAAAGLALESHPIAQRGPDGEALSIDVAVSAGANTANTTSTLVISSGLHGVEGFLGAAIQLGCLLPEAGVVDLLARQRVVLIHALNPYGFAWRRRWNEDGVDLNRNFLLDGERFRGAPPLYRPLNRFINPRSSPTRVDPFLLKLVSPLFKYGFAALKRTIPVGQYAFHKGLFYGGRQPAPLQGILRQHLPRWVGASPHITHLDIHTGLGDWATYKLLLEWSATADEQARLAQQFGGDCLELDTDENTSFKSRGGLGTWCKALLPDRRYDFATAEFGTYSNISVIAALRAENRAHWWGEPGGDQGWAKARLVERFAPASNLWRERCVLQGLRLCEQACLTNVGATSG